MHGATGGSAAKWRDNTSDTNSPKRSSGRNPTNCRRLPQDRSAVQQQQTVLARWLLLPVQQEEQVVQAGTQRPRQAQQAIASYQRGVEGGVAVLREAEEDAEQLVGQPAVEGAGEEERGGGDSALQMMSGVWRSALATSALCSDCRICSTPVIVLCACDLLDDGIGTLGEESFDAC